MSASSFSAPHAYIVTRLLPGAVTPDPFWHQRVCSPLCNDTPIGCRQEMARQPPLGFENIHITMFMLVLQPMT
jgi:hypothetical protein